MKVFFIASPRTKDLNICRFIYDTIESAGHNNTSNFMVTFDPKTFYAADEKTWYKRYILRVKEIAQADICVFESSMHSLAIGQLVQESLRRDKPVIVLHNNTFKPNFIISTQGREKRIQVLEYAMENLEDTLKYALEEAVQLVTTRFTMLMPPEYSQYLDQINKTQGISRSDYIRNLIAEDMRSRR